MALGNSVSPVRIIFITAVILLTALSVFSYKQNLELIQKAELVNHTNLVKLEIGNVLSFLKGAETSSRGYLLINDTSFLRTYRESETDLATALTALNLLIDDNDKQQENFMLLKTLVSSKMSYVRNYIRPDYDRDSLSIKILKGQAEMDRAVLQANLMLHEEEKLLSLRTIKLNEAVSFAPNVNIILAGSSIILLIFSYFKILRELEKSNFLQKDLVNSNAVLEKSNAELAQFAYVASHDLQEPLRKIQTFVSLIQDTEHNLSDKGKDYFSRVGNSAKRMQQLIRDILSYSKEGNPGQKTERVALNEILNAAKDQLEAALKEGNATVHASALPSVMVVRYQFEQVFLNLLSNALKFARPGIPSVITITAETTKGSGLANPAANNQLSYHCIKVKDNGIGFDQQYGERIFKIFHRLNTKEAYDGNGIGLSIVKKIMEGHGGFVTATGTAGEGAVFSLYLPMQ